jgi:hypothetical protein
MRRWSTYTDYTDRGPAVFIRVETGTEKIAVPVLFHTLLAKQTYAERVAGIIEYLTWRANQIERIRENMEQCK